MGNTGWLPSKDQGPADRLFWVYVFDEMGLNEVSVPSSGLPDAEAKDFADFLTGQGAEQPSANRRVLLARRYCENWSVEHFAEARSLAMAAHDGSAEPNIS